MKPKDTTVVKVKGGKDASKGGGKGTKRKVRNYIPADLNISNGAATLQGDEKVEGSSGKKTKRK